MSFIELRGGEIQAPNGCVVARLCLDQMTIDEAQRAMKAIIAALDAEFPAPSAVKVDVRADDINQQVTDAVKAAAPSIIKAVKEIERRGGR